MEHNANLNAQQMQCIRQEFQAEVMQVIGFGRQEYEAVQNEARQHQRFWVAKYSNLEELASESQSRLLQEMGSQQNALAFSTAQMNQEQSEAQALRGQLAHAETESRRYHQGGAMEAGQASMLRTEMASQSEFANELAVMCQQNETEMRRVEAECRLELAFKENDLNTKLADQARRFSEGGDER